MKSSSISLIGTYLSNIDEIDVRNSIDIIRYYISISNF